jgi:regulator of sigma E protease
MLAIASLAFLIVVHEGGHYFVARWCKMRIERFSIGFGPGVLKHRSKTTGTIFQLAPIPFGGFVEIRGMNIAEEVDPDDAFAYPNRPAWQRFVTIFAGPATNYLSAVVLAFLLYNCNGMPSSEAFHVAGVKAGYDAVGKLEDGDQITAVNHVAMFAPNTKDLSKVVNAHPGLPVVLTIQRGQRNFEVEILPKLYKDDKGQQVLDPDTKAPVYLLGILQEPDMVDVGVIGATEAALTYPIIQTKAIVGGLVDIITGREKADPGGPVRIFGEFSKAWELGIVSGIKLLMLLSVYLGIFNLLPLPALDGGRLVFLGYELVTRRRANPKIEATVHMGGIMVLGVVMVLVTLHDCHVF